MQLVCLGCTSATFLLYPQASDEETRTNARLAFESVTGSYAEKYRQQRAEVMRHSADGAADSSSAPAINVAASAALRRQQQQQQHAASAPAVKTVFFNRQHAGWSLHMDKAGGGQVFFYHAPSAHSQWTPPDGVWTPYRTTEGDVYFHNAATRESTWQTPDQKAEEAIQEEIQKAEEQAARKIAQEHLQLQDAKKEDLQLQDGKEYGKEDAKEYDKEIDGKEYDKKDGKEYGKENGKEDGETGHQEYLQFKGDMAVAKGCFTFQEYLDYLKFKEYLQFKGDMQLLRGAQRDRIVQLMNEQPDRIVGPEGVTLERLVDPKKENLKSQTSTDVLLRLRAGQQEVDDDTDAPKPDVSLTPAGPPPEWPVPTDLCTFRTYWRSCADSASSCG
jgi:hypothetical protein